MITLINSKDGIIIRSSVPVPAEIEDIVHNPQYMESIVNAERDLNINHRIETKDNVHISIVECNGGNELNPEMCSEVAMSHSKLLEFLHELKDKQINLDGKSDEPEHEPTDEELFQCLFEYLKQTFGVIIIGIVK